MLVIYVFSIPEVEICSSGEVIEAIILIPQLLRWVCGKMARTIKMKPNMDGPGG